MPREGGALVTTIEQRSPGAPTAGAIAARALALRNGASQASLVSIPVPPVMLAAFRSLGLDGLRARSLVTWERPSEGTSLFGLGETIRLSGQRGEGLGAAMPALRSLAAAARSAVSGHSRPRFFGGCRFQPGGRADDPAWDPLGGWQFVLPRFLVAVRGDAMEASLTLLMDDASTTLSEAALIEAEATAALAPRSPGRTGHPSHRDEGLDDPAWQDAVAATVREIEAGRYQKAVLARQLHIVQERPIEPATVLERLRLRYPGCYVFSFAAGETTWLGASPELLVSLERGEVQAASLAGSRPRGIDDESDRRLAQDLLASVKERAEHGFVVSAICEALAPVCSALEAPETPVLMRMSNIQHLFTPVTARVRPGIDILDLVDRVHPTPAVGGWPREASFEAIERLEQMDRGWYAAPIGWMDLAGEGEFAVALRAARVCGDEATLFAGAGIVEGSIPAEELAETELKFRPLREALAGD